MKKVILLITILTVACSKEDKTPEKPNHWRYMYSFGNVLALKEVWKNEVTGTCVLFKGDSGVIELSKADCE